MSWYNPQKITILDFPHNAQPYAELFVNPPWMLKHQKILYAASLSCRLLMVLYFAVHPLYTLNVVNFRRVLWASVWTSGIYWHAVGGLIWHCGFHTVQISLGSKDCYRQFSVKDSLLLTSGATWSANHGVIWNAWYCPETWFKVISHCDCAWDFPKTNKADAHTNHTFTLSFYHLFFFSNRSNRLWA